MKKIDLPSMPRVIMKDGSYKDCLIRLVHIWTRVSADGRKSDEMGIIVIQSNDPLDSHPFTKTFKLKELTFITFR